MDKAPQSLGFLPRSDDIACSRARSRPTPTATPPVDPPDPRDRKQVTICGAGRRIAAGHLLSGSERAPLRPSSRSRAMRAGRACTRPRWTICRAARQRASAPPAPGPSRARWPVARPMCQAGKARLASFVCASLPPTLPVLWECAKVAMLETVPRGGFTFSPGVRPLPRTDEQLARVLAGIRRERLLPRERLNSQLVHPSRRTLRGRLSLAHPPGAAGAVAT
jgi:hypothetical protein